jgi:hypothetical protein
LRTKLTGKNGTRPELLVPDVFGTRDPRQLLFTWKDATLKVFVDSIENSYSFRFSPSFMFFWFVSPSSLSQIRINQISQRIFTLMYLCLFFLPVYFGISRMLSKKLVVASRHLTSTRP